VKVIMLKTIASGTAKIMDRTQIEKISMAVKRGMPTPCTLLQEATALYLSHKNKTLIRLLNCFKVILHFFLEISSFYNSPRVKKLSFTVFESIQPIFLYLEEYQ